MDSVNHMKRKLTKKLLKIVLYTVETPQSVHHTVICLYCYKLFCLAGHLLIF
jgi:hypothetical protein